MVGSTELSLIWRQKVTPAAGLISRLAPWTPRTSDPASTGSPLQTWPTPQHRENGGGEYADPIKAAARIKSGHQVNLQDHVQAMTATWPTPRANENSQGPTNAQAMADAGSSWMGQRRGATVSTVATLHEPTGPILPSQGVAPTWPTATSSDSRMSGSLGYGGQQFMTLTDAANVSTWATPMAHEARLGYQHRHDGAKGSQKSLTTEVVDSLGLGANVATERLGPITSGLPEQTAKRGALNPAFVCWLMGYPLEWDACAPTAMRSSRKSRPK